MARRGRSKQKPKELLALVFAVLFWFAVIAKCGSNNNKMRITPTPQNIETMIALIMSQTPTETITPTPTETPVPTATWTFMPTVTPVPYDSGAWLPSVMENENTVYYPDGSSWTPGNPEPIATENGTYYFADGSSWTTYTEVPISYEQSDSCHDPSCGCVIKGNVNERRGTYIYHCPNSPSYADTKINSSRGDRWFCSEAEAIAAGFRAPKNAPPCGGF